jgi:elongation factor Ts
MITAQQVNSLRQKTGVSMMQCKKALEESGGDETKAIEILRKKGEAKAAEKSERATREGIVVTRVANDKAAIVKLLCETDFVAKNEEFVAIANKAAETALEKGADAAREEAEPAIRDLFTKLGENMTIEIRLLEGEGIADYVHSNRKLGALVKLKDTDETKARDIAMHIAAMNPSVISPSEVPDELVSKEREIWDHQLNEEGKPAEIIERILSGKEKKFREENALLKQAFVKDGDKTVEQYLESNTVVEFVRSNI